MPIDLDNPTLAGEHELRERFRREIVEGRQGTRGEAHVSPHFGDGGSHTQPGNLWFDPQSIRPLGDHILVVLDAAPADSSTIAITDPAERRSRIGTVLKVGPGAWKDWKTHRDRDAMKRLPMTLKPGDRVLIGAYGDWESWDCDYEGRGPNIVLCQEADVRLILEN